MTNQAWLITILWILTIAIMVQFVRIGVSPLVKALDPIDQSLPLKAKAKLRQERIAFEFSCSDQANRRLHLDWFFIAVYTTLGITQLAFMLGSPLVPNSMKNICWVLIVVAIVTACLDVAENRSLLLVANGDPGSAVVAKAEAYVHGVRNWKVFLPLTVCDFGLGLVIWEWWRRVHS